MAWSVPLGRLFGIPIRVHLSLVLLLGWIAAAGSQKGLPGIALVAVGMFACVIAHELGHGLVARRLGVRVLDITLLPFGGVARMAAMPRKPRHELWIALAGPAVNFVLAPAFFAAHWLFEPRHPDLLSLTAPGLGMLAALNLLIGAFNLLPAFPMDGGRVLRALLAERTAYLPATRAAAHMGQLLALCLATYGVIGGEPVFLFVAMFIFLGAVEESSRTQTAALLEGVAVGEAMMTRFSTLQRADSLGRAADLLLAGTQSDFPVMEGDEVAGILTRQRLIRALARGGREPYVSEVMTPAPEPVSPTTPLDEALRTMLADGAPFLPVYAEEGLCGLLTRENAAELVMVRSALARKERRGR
jgi:Zn-dependent protease/CBS domain-containing protein